MDLKTFSLVAALGVFVAVPAFAADAESNKQAPAPQGTVAPDSNAKAKTGSANGTAASEEQMKSQSPGKSEETDLSKSSKSGEGSGVTTSREAANPQAPAPNNTSRPE